MTINELYKTPNLYSLPKQQLIHLLKLTKCRINYSDPINLQNLKNTLDFIQNISEEQSLITCQWHILTPLQINILIDLLENKFIVKTSVIQFLFSKIQNKVKLSALAIWMLKDLGVDAQTITLQQAYAIYLKYVKQNNYKSYEVYTLMNALSLQEFLIQAAYFEYIHKYLDSTAYIECSMIYFYNNYLKKNHINMEMSSSAHYVIKLNALSVFELMKPTRLADDLQFMNQNNLLEALAQMFYRILQTPTLLSKYTPINEFAEYIHDNANNAQDRSLAFHLINVLTYNSSDELLEKLLDRWYVKFTKQESYETMFIELITSDILNPIQLTLLNGLSKYKSLTNYALDITGIVKLFNIPEFVNKLNYLLACDAPESAVINAFVNESAKYDLDKLPEVDIANYLILTSLLIDKKRRI